MNGRLDIAFPAGSGSLTRNHLSPHVYHERRVIGNSSLTRDYSTVSGHGRWLMCANLLVIWECSVFYLKEIPVSWTLSLSLDLSCQLALDRKKNIPSSSGYSFSHCAWCWCCNLFWYSQWCVFLSLCFGMSFRPIQECFLSHIRRN